MTKRILCVSVNLVATWKLFCACWERRLWRLFGGRNTERSELPTPPSAMVSPVLDSPCRRSRFFPLETASRRRFVWALGLQTVLTAAREMSNSVRSPGSYRTLSGKHTQPDQMTAKYKTPGIWSVLFFFPHTHFKLLPTSKVFLKGKIALSKI